MLSLHCKSASSSAHDGLGEPMILSHFTAAFHDFEGCASDSPD